MNAFRAAAVVFAAVLLLVVPAVTPAQDAAATKEEAIKKDHLAIEGTWRAIALEINGNLVSADDVKKITTENGRDGEWAAAVAATQSSATAANLAMDRATAYVAKTDLIMDGVLC